MSFIFYFESAEEALHIGRPDFQLLNDQTLMELLVEKVDNNEIFKNDDGDFMHIQDWRGVRLGENGTVLSIDFFDMLTKGELQFEYVPAKCTDLSLGLTDCTGEIPWTMIHNEIRLFNAPYNDFYGTIDLTALPKQLIDIFLRNNRFTGTVCFHRLPENLVTVDLSCNRLTGQVDLRQITRPLSGISSYRWDLHYSRQEIPAPDVPMCVLLRFNAFDGDIMVNDVENVSDTGQFGHLTCDYMIDEAGGKRGLKKN